jgi:PAS domain S-box-containing protein
MAKGKTKVLLVEDNPGDVRLIQEMVKEAGANLYELAVAGTLDGALGRLRQEAFDAVFLDLSLPDSSGIATMKSIQHNAPHIALVVITGLNDDTVALEVLKIGAEDFLVKGKFDGPILVRALRYAIERKRAEKALRSEHIMLMLTEDIANIGSWEWDIATDTVKWSDELFRIFQRDPREGAPSFAEHPALYHPDDMARLQQAVEAAVTDGTPYELELRIIRKDGETRVCVVRGVVDMELGGRPVRLLGSLQDITDREQAQDALRQSEGKYRLLADNVHDVIFVLDMNLHYTYISPSVKILRGYEPEEMFNQPSFESLTPASMELAMKAMSEIMELEKSGRREEIPMSRTLQLEMLRKDKTTVWTEVRFSLIRDENQQPVGIMGVTRDITERKKADEKLLQTLKSLRKAVGATIQVMVSAIEMRDPYTAGHQLRVANLAVDVATEMGLSQDKIEGIRMAGTIHDIGKLSIPSEILTKPTKLTDLEFSLIKEHSRSGYEMLKDVESPWPLAQIAYQHHERMDGSGYPRNLKGDEILIEARIMAVADVVEAIASHRPYRASLGIEAALEEIRKNKGILYDDAVANACLRLFREKGYQLT